MVASRKYERLEKTAEELRSALPKDNAPRIVPMECNIRKEEQVLILLSYLLLISGNLYVIKMLLS